jgi:hypothetical protein
MTERYERWRARQTSKQQARKTDPEPAPPKAHRANPLAVSLRPAAATADTMAASMARIVAAKMGPHRAPAGSTQD